MHKKGTIDKTKKIAIVSTIIFSVITILSFLYFTSCHDGNCSFNLDNIINICILTCGIAGIIYCFIVLKSFNSKVDKTLIEYKEILASDKLDDNNKLSFDKKNDIS